MSISQILNAIPQQNILVVGDAMLDCYITGKVARISPEAPVPIIKNADTQRQAGGSANVARNITALGGVANLIAIIGADEYGRQLQHLLKQDERLHAHLMTDSSRPTTTKIRHVAGGQHLLRSDIEDDRPFSDKHYQALLTQIETLADSVDYAILSDYDKGLLPADIFGKILQILAKNQVRTIIDPKKTDFKVFHGADLVTPNRHELQQASKMPVGNDAEITLAARHLLQQTQIKAMLITRSEQGMSYISMTEALHIPTQVQSVFDVAGAGDTVIAAMALALSSGANMSDAMAFANLAAAVSVSKHGTATVAPHEILGHAPHKRVKSLAEKIITADTGAQKLSEWRAQGLKIGFTNGCFDILHAGHVHSLTEAATHCDRLVIGLNDDDSVRRLKGDTRPINPQQARATVLAGLQASDAVILFAEDTPLELIKIIQPDMLFKGADYAEEDIVGADIVKTNGGQVIRLPLLPNFSTSQTIADSQK